MRVTFWVTFFEKEAENDGNGRRLMEMDLVTREVPFGASPRASKRTLYRIADPFLRFWF